MAETIDQLIARGTEIYNETEAGANTHERVGQAFERIPELMGTPLWVLTTLQGAQAEILSGVSSAVFSAGTGSQNFRLNPMLNFKVYGWAYVTGGSNIPSNVPPTFVAQTGLLSEADLLNGEFYTQLSSVFGDPASSVGDYFFWIPAIQDSFGRETWFRVIRSQIFDV